MVTFLFWNIQKKPILHRVARLAAKQSVDVVMLAECAADPAAVLGVLNASGETYAFPHSGAKRVRLFTRFAKSRVKEVFTDLSERLTVRQLTTPNHLPVLLGMVHLPSVPDFKQSGSRLSFAVEVAGELRRVEEKRGNARTVLVGDFNLAPFDDGMVSSFGFHALMTRELARQKHDRVVAL